MQYNLNIQRELFKGSVLTVGYVGSRGVDLLSFRDYNPPVPVTLPNGTAAVRQSRHRHFVSAHQSRSSERRC